MFRQQQIVLSSEEGGVLSGIVSNRRYVQADYLDSINNAMSASSFIFDLAISENDIEMAPIVQVYRACLRLLLQYNKLFVGADKLFCRIISGLVVFFLSPLQGA